MQEDDNTVYYHGTGYKNLLSACMDLDIDYRFAAGLMTTGTLKESEVLDFLLGLK